MRCIARNLTGAAQPCTDISARRVADLDGNIVPAIVRNRLEDFEDFARAIAERRWQ